MTNLIQRVRLLANAGTADFTAGTVEYWTDDQLQTFLDQHSVVINREELDYDIEYLGGTAYYHDYYSEYGNLEEAAS